MFLAIVPHPNGAFIPVLVGGDGADSDCLAQFSSKQALVKAMQNTMVARVYGYHIVDTEELE